MPLTRCSSASWSTSGLAVLLGGRSCDGGRLALGSGGLVAGGVLRRVTLGRPVLSRAVLGSTALGRIVLGSIDLGRTVLGSIGLGRAILGRIGLGSAIL